MKIAQISPIIERVPCKKYGGTERVVHALTEELVKRGHDVTLFASGDSITSAKLVSVYPKGLREAGIDHNELNPMTLLNIGLAYNLNERFDIIHDHNNYIGLPIANLVKTPTVITFHNVITDKSGKFLRIFQKPNIVTISKSQSRGIPWINHAGTVYNGLDTKKSPFSEDHNGYLLFVGRISMDKGVHIAIEIAKKLDMPLIIAAKLDEADVSYFKEYVKDKINGKVRWIGEVDETQRNKLMSKALCLLHPALFKEPFGLTLIEAMACGCPVIAFNTGSIPEIIVDGKTGFIVNDKKEMALAVGKIGKIKRLDCRQHAIKNFSAQRMADGYEAVYEKVLAEQYWPIKV